MQTRDNQVFYDKYSILSLLTWTRLEKEPPFGINLINEEYVNDNPLLNANIKNMTISSTKSQVILRDVPLSDFTQASEEEASE